jgi:Ca-activated chloride channel family protein
MYLNTLDTKMISNQGTAIGDALQTALNAFEQGGSMDGRSRAVIVITDGETHDEEALDVAKKMAEQNIHLITVGAGTSKGAPIPVIGRGSRKDYKKDKEGNIVLSRLDEDMLKRIASAGNGIYLNLEAGKSVVQQIVKSVDALDKEQDAEFEYSEYNQHFQLFLLAGILLLLMEWIISDRGSLWIRKILNRENSNG